MMSTRQAVILAGGKGTRLRERLGGRPKPLVDIAGVPLLGRQLATLRQSGITDIVILVNHAAEQIKNYCADGAFADLRITLLDDGEPRGTAGALLYAFDHLDERFLVVYGDTLFDVDLNRFWQAHVEGQGAATLFLHPNDHPFDSDLVEIDDEQRVVAFHAAPHPKDGCLPNLVNAAMYVLERDALAFWRDAPVPTDIARDLFPAMLENGAQLRGYVSFEYIKDIGTPKRLDKAVGHLQAGVVARARRDQAQKAVFLDRDGTINPLRGYLARASEMMLLEGAAQAVKWFNDHEYRAVVVTNQPVLARGDASFEDMRHIHGRMETLLGETGAFVDGIYLCPHHPDSGFPGEVRTLKTACSCRKPGIGLIRRAQADLNIDLTKSWFVGDSTGDMLAASQAGLLSVLVETGEAGRDGKYPVRADFVARDLLDAARIIGDVFPILQEKAVPFAAQIESGSVVLVGGLAKLGKSSFASVLKHVLAAWGKRAEIVSLDGFLRGSDARLPGVLGRYDLAAIQPALQTWLSGTGQDEARIPIYDRFARSPAGGMLRLKLPSDAIVILEGVPALLLPLATSRPILRLFVEGDELHRKGRVVEDLTRRGENHGAAVSIYHSRQDDEASKIRLTRDQADVIVTL